MEKYKALVLNNIEDVYSINYEEMLMNEEGLQETANKLIHIGKPIEMDDALLEQQLKRLDEASREESEDIKDIVAEIVPTYKRECKV